MSLDLISGIDATGVVCTHANQMVLWVTIRSLKSSSVGAFTWSSLRWFQSVVVQTKKEFLCCSVLEWGVKCCLSVCNVLRFEVTEFCWPNLSFVCWEGF